MAYAFPIALRHLRAKKRTTVSVITLIAITGVALGVAALVSILSITTGFQREFQAKVLGVNAHVLIMKYGVDFEEYRDVMLRAERYPEVVGANPFLIHQMMLAAGDRLSGVLVKGVDPERMQRVLELPSQMVEGTMVGLRTPQAVPAQREDVSDDPRWNWLGNETQRPVAEVNAEVPSPLPNVEVASPEEIEAWLQGNALPPSEASDSDAWVDLSASDEALPSELPGMILGRALARSLRLDVGDTVRLVSPTSGLAIGDGATTQSGEFKVIGLFEAGFQEYDTRLVYIDLYEAEKFQEQGDAVTGVELRLSNIDGSAELARSLERDLGGPFHTLDWAELNRNLFAALEIQKIVLAFVTATIIFVAAFMVIATLIMIVLEKKRDIAILKAMGASDSTILSIFAYQGVVIGFAGTLLGLLLGGGLVLYLERIRLPLDPKVYLIDHLPVVVDSNEFVLTTVIALAICSIATLAPSLWAARMLPVDAFRPD